jgi:hypothetical protein
VAEAEAAVQEEEEEEERTGAGSWRRAAPQGVLRCHFRTEIVELVAQWSAFDGGRLRGPFVACLRVSLSCNQILKQEYYGST